MSSILKKSSIEQILTFSPPERMRKMSEESEFDDEEDEGHDVNGQKFGGFTFKKKQTNKQTNKTQVGSPPPSASTSARTISGLPPSPARRGLVQC